MILAIDPGTTHSAYLFMGMNGTIRDFSSDCNNEELRCLCAVREIHDVAIEEVRSYGMPVGKEVFDTVRWIGRFEQTCRDRGVTPNLVGRQEVKLHWCKSSKAKDSNVRQALLDFYGKPATKGIIKHAWSALAIAGYWRAALKANWL